MSPAPRVIELTEYRTTALHRDNLSEQAATLLHKSFGPQVAVEPPSFKNDYTWQLTSRGWVGYIPLTEETHLALAPKVPIGNLFGMLEYAYQLDFRILEGVIDSESIRDLFERLAMVLASRVMDRIRKGLYRSYVKRQEELPYVRGRLDVRSHMAHPYRPEIPCQFRDHTVDLEDNQILLWTLMQILMSEVCTDHSLPHLQLAARALQGFCSERYFSPEDCVARKYNRLNEDYQPLHALCRFFLEHVGPTHQVGDRRMIPVLLDMNRLFELFVIEWLKQHIPEGFVVEGHETLTFNLGNVRSVDMDITVKEAGSAQICLVLDTKYKRSEKPENEDMEQVVAYAEGAGCKNAVLVYPVSLPMPISGRWGKEMHIESLTFGLEGDLNSAGQEFLQRLLSIPRHGSRQSTAN